MKVLTITLGVFVPIYLQTHAGLRGGIDLRYVELAQTVGLSRAGFIRRVVLPGGLCRGGSSWDSASQSPARGCRWW